MAVTSRDVAADAPAAGLGRAILVAVAALVAAVMLPVVLRGAPLADDFNNCLAPQEQGLGGFLASSWERLGMVRPARFVEILVTTGVCRSLPFGVAIAVPLVLTFSAAFLIRGLLRDLGTSAPWPDIGAATWLLQPLGTEAALWPAALHVPLGVCFALLATRAHHHGRHGLAALATVGAVGSVEQAVFALPFAAWLVASPNERRRAAASSGIVCIGALAAFAMWPGSDPRLQADLFDRLGGILEDPSFYVLFPAVGMGLHSIPLAALWAFPWSVAVLAAGAVAGVSVARRVWERARPGQPLARAAAAFVGLVLLVNVPVVLAEPRQGSPRIFTPTWLVLSVGVGFLAARWRPARPRVVAGIAGAFAGGALLSLALSVSVRLASADAIERATAAIAARIPDGGEVAICGIPRTVTTPAPRGAFAVHELTSDWAADDALAYHTGKRATFHLAGELWDTQCPIPDGDIVVLRFDDLVAEDP